MNNFINIFLTKNTPFFKFLRTIFQAVVGLVIANIDMITSVLEIPTAYKPFIVTMVMIILTPLMARLKQTETYDIDELEFIEMDNSLSHDDMETEGVENDG